MAGMGHSNRLLSEEELENTVRPALDGWDLDGKRVLTIIPDATRSGPIPKMFRLISEHLRGKAESLDFLIALGTHQLLSEEQINSLVGVGKEEWNTTFSGLEVFNHEWWKEENLHLLRHHPSRGG